MTAKQNRPPVPAPDERDFHYWEKIKDIIDQLIDTILNYRQAVIRGSCSNCLSCYRCCSREPCAGDPARSCPAFWRSVHPFRRAYRSANLLHAGSVQRSTAAAPPAQRGG